MIERNTMKNFLEEVRNERQMCALTGLSMEAFHELLKAFSACLENLQNERYRKSRKTRKRRPGGGRKGSLRTPEDKLFFILFYLKNYPTFDVLGFIFDLSLSKAEENVKKLLPVLKSALGICHALPTRRFSQASEFKQLVDNVEDVMIDVTERPHFRHKNAKQQRRHFSGKKRRHTVKNTTLSDPEKRILFVGETRVGSQHDYSLFKDEFNPKEDWFESVRGWVDLGYQGIKKDYSSSENIQIPHKKPRKSLRNPNPSLTPKQKQENKQISRIRVVVEQAIGGMKIFNILATKFRNRRKNMVDEVIFLVAGLWNMKNSFVIQ